jgi:hypothetical protein
MNPSRSRLAPVALAACLVVPGIAMGQTFVRVTDPANPIVTDRYQSGGGCFVDLVGDGHLDLFVANGNVSNQPNALYRNTRDGGFVKVVAGPVVTDGGSSIGGTFGDFDHDGLLDLFVTNRNNFGNFLYRGLGDTAFAKVTTGPLVADIANSNSGSWVDVDNDGNLDLYVVNFQGGDFLYSNGGPTTFAFTRIDTAAVTAGQEFSIPGAWADVNDDGLEDLFIGNAGNQNDYLYVNHGGLFFTRTVIPDAGSTLGASWGDYDNDGAVDLLVVHYQTQRCTLYHNGGPPAFDLTPVASTIATAAGNWVGSAWGDYDNDGNLDSFVAQDNGAPGALYHNDGPPGYGFTRVTTGPIATDAGYAFGAVWGDYDRDGQLDLFVTDRLGSGNRLYHNEGAANHWLTVRCIGTTSNRAGIGAKVRVHASVAGVPGWQYREVTGQTGYNSQNLDQHFGLGDAVVVDSLVIDWPSGHRDAWAGVVPDTLLVLTEGSGVVAVEPAATPVSAGLRLEAPLPNPCRGGAMLSFSLPRACRARLEVFDVRGHRVTTALDRVLPVGPQRARVTVPAAAAAGIYFCRLAAGSQATTVRLAVVP